MNKQQIIAPLVAMAIVALVVVLIVNKNQRHDLLRVRVVMLAQDLIATTNSPALDAISPELHAKLVQFLAAPSRIEGIREGDEPGPIGDGRATVRVFFVNEETERLALRLQPTSDGEQFTVLGFWTPAAAPQ